MSNAVYKGKTYSASYYEDRKPNSVLIRSKHVQEEYETEEISLSCEEFVEKYRSLVTDVF